MLSTYGQLLLQSYNYSAVLSPSDWPTVQNYPGIASILPNVFSFLQSAQTLLETAAQNSTFPSSVSYGYVESLANQGQAIGQQLDALSPTPIIFNAEFWDVVEALQALLIYPELMSP